MRGGGAVLGTACGFAMLPASTHAATTRATGQSAAVFLPQGLLAVLCGLLALALLWCGYQLLRQRRRAGQLLAQVQASEQQARQQATRLEAVVLERSDLERQLREQAEAFERLANEDDLSGLPNRRAFDDALARDMALARRAGRPLSLVVLSIDHLKQVNGDWSRAVGDLVLCEVGDLLRRSLRASDMPARLGNKEFALLLTDTGLAEAELVCQRLQRLFGQYGQWGGHPEGEIKVSFSAGAVQLGDDDQAPVLFYQRAKNALAQAKREGRARTCVA